MFTRILSLFPLKDSCQPLPFPTPSKLLTLHVEAKSYCFTVSCVLEGMVYYLRSFPGRDFLHFGMLQIKYNSQLSQANKTEMTTRALRSVV